MGVLKRGGSEKAFWFRFLFNLYDSIKSAYQIDAASDLKKNTS